MGIQIGTGKNGLLTYTLNGKNLDQSTIDALVNNATKAGLLNPQLTA
jgi:hypothetical protein